MVLIRLGLIVVMLISLLCAILWPEYEMTCYSIIVISIIIFFNLLFIDYKNGK